MFYKIKTLDFIKIKKNIMKISLNDFITEGCLCTAEVEYGTTKITFYIDNNAETIKEEAILSFNAICEDIDNWIQKICNYAYQNLAVTANSYWLDDEYDEPLTRQDFVDGINKKIYFSTEKEEMGAQFFVKEFAIYIALNKEFDLIGAELL